jgi:hypothetical protein
MKPSDTDPRILSLAAEVAKSPEQNVPIILLKLKGKKKLKTIFFLWDWGLNSELCSCKTGALLFDPHFHSTVVLVILEIGSHELFAWAGL